MKESLRSLLCQLRDARRKLAHHKRHSYMGKEAKKEIATAEAELMARGVEIPPEGEETKQWDRKPTTPTGVQLDAMEKKLTTLSHAQDCPARHCGECLCRRSEIIETLQDNGREV